MLAYCFIPLQSLTRFFQCDNLDSMGVVTCCSWLAAQAYEAWRTHGDWVAQQQPELGPAVAARFKMASSVTAEEFMAADSRRQR
jgi:hypothetical protein